MRFPSSVDLATARVSAREYVGAGRAHALSLDVACIACPPQDVGAAARDWLTPPMTIRHPLHTLEDASVGPHVLRR